MNVVTRNRWALGLAVLLGSGAFMGYFAARQNYRVATTWALYAAHQKSGPYVVFLDPFPSKNSCELEKSLVTSAGGFASCRQKTGILRVADANNLAWEFLSPAAPGIRICTRAIRK